MSLNICYFNVANPVGKFKEGKVFILYGEGSQFEYSRLTANAILHKAGIVAIAHGLDVTKEGGKAVIVYATREACEPFGGWIQGKTLDEVFPDESEEGGRRVNLINVDGADYIRDDKNCIAGDDLKGVPSIELSIFEKLVSAGLPPDVVHQLLNCGSSSLTDEQWEIFVSTCRSHGFDELKREILTKKQK